MSFSAEWFSDGQIAVALIPKCASSSIRDAVKTDYGSVNPQDVIAVARRIAWVRDPMERLVSAYSYFHHSVCGLPGSVTGTWPHFVDYTFKHDDPHWTLQRDLLTYDGEFLPNELYDFTDLQKTWPFRGLLPWLRGVRHVEVDTAYRREELDNRYAGDYELCRCVAT